jgi:hypothetical protein
MCPHDAQVTLAAADLRDPAVSAAIAGMLATFHARMVRSAPAAAVRPPLRPIKAVLLRSERITSTAF